MTGGYWAKEESHQKAKCSMISWPKLVLGFNIPLEKHLGAFNGDQYLRPQFPSFHLDLVPKNN
jgi:hypothetical protein